MEVRQLNTLIRAAQFQSFSKAAESLGYSQSAVTVQIKALEEELGVALFDRRPGRISLTRAGEALLAGAQQVLAAASQLQGQARELQGEITGSLVLGTMGDPEKLRLGSLVGGLLQVLPLVEVKTRGGLAEALREQVAADQLSGAFYVGPHIPREAAGLQLQTLHFRVVGAAALRDQLRHASSRDVADMP